MTKISPYLSFENNCKEAMTFYHECIGGTLSFMTVEEGGMAAMMPPEYKDAILHSSITLDGAMIMGSDMHRGPLTDGNSFTICINCKSEADMEKFFKNISSGGEVLNPVEQMPWGAKLCGVMDKFKKQWTFYYDEKDNL